MHCSSRHLVLRKHPKSTRAECSEYIIYRGSFWGIPFSALLAGKVLQLIPGMFAFLRAKRHNTSHQSVSRNVLTVVSACVVGSPFRKLVWTGIWSFRPEVLRRTHLGYVYTEPILDWSAPSSEGDCCVSIIFLKVSILDRYPEGFSLWHHRYVMNICNCRSS